MPSLIALFIFIHAIEGHYPIFIELIRPSWLPCANKIRRSWSKRVSNMSRGVARTVVSPSRKRLTTTSKCRSVRIAAGFGWTKIHCTSRKG